MTSTPFAGTKQEQRSPSGQDTMRRLRECSDEEFVLRVIAGERRAFAALVKRHQALVLRACMDVLHQRQDAEDASQATFLVLWQKADSIQDTQKFKSWLYGVARQQSLSIHRRNQRQDEHQRLYTANTQITDEALVHEIQVIVRTELQRLPGKYRIALVLHYLEGKSKAEIAAALGCPEGTVSNRLARGRILLRKRLARYGSLASD